MARNCLTNSARTTNFSFKTALENAAKDWDVLAAVAEGKESRARDALQGFSRARRAVPRSGRLWNLRALTRAGR